MKNWLRGWVLSVVMVALIIGAESCYYDNEETLYPSSATCATTMYSYAVDVQPLIVGYCATAGCHNASKAGNVALLTYDQVKEQAARVNQRAVVDRTMPPGGGMTAAQLAIIKCWIANGTNP